MCVCVCAYVHATELLDAALEEEEGGTLMARKVGEAVQNTLGAVVGAIDIPLGETPLHPINKGLLGEEKEQFSL